MREHEVFVSVALARSRLAALRARFYDERLTYWTDILAMLEQFQARFELLRGVLDRASDVVFAKDRLGRYLMINPGGAKLFGRKAEDIVGHDDSELFGQECAQQVGEQERAVMDSGLARTFEETLPIRGVLTRLLTSEAPWYEPRGSVRGLIGTARDVSGRARAPAPAAHEVAVEQHMRHSLAADLHDGLHQYAALAEMKLGALRRASAAELQEPLAQIERLVEHADRCLRLIPLQPSG